MTEHITGIRYVPGGLRVWYTDPGEPSGEMCYEYMQPCNCDECALPSREAQP